MKSSETPPDTTRAVTNHFVAASSKDLSFSSITTVEVQLFQQLKAQIGDVLEKPPKGLTITVNVDMITDPLVSRVDNALSNFTDGTHVAFTLSDHDGHRFSRKNILPLNVAASHLRVL